MPSHVLSTPPHLSPGRRAVLAALVAYPEATVITIAEAAHVGRSSAAAALNLLEQQGLAVRRMSAVREVSHRPADLWSSTPAAAPALAAISTEPEPDGSAVAEEPLEDAKDANPGLHPTAEAVEDAPSVEAAKPTAPSEAPARLGKGMLRDAVREHLRAHPEAMFTPTALSKALSRSSGAISNALDVLVADGEASLVLDKPRTFRAKSLV